MNNEEEFEIRGKNDGLFCRCRKTADGDIVLFTNNATLSLRDLENKVKGPSCRVLRSKHNHIKYRKP